MSDAERRLRELEQQVRAERANTVAREQSALASQRPVRLSEPNVNLAPEEKPKKKRWLSWKTKALLAGGLIVAGAITLWIAWKVIKIAFYLGLAAAVAFGVWYLFFRKKKDA